MVRQTLAKHTDTKNLEFIAADLTKDEGWDQAAAGCDFVLHLASPFPTEAPKDENELILPAREGTLRVLRAAQIAGVKRVVLVSSVAGIIGGHERENRTFDESDWTDTRKTDYAYAKSKTLAEQAAWDFIKGPENRSGMDLVSVNPSNVFGPVLDNRHHTSTEWFLTLLRREIPGLTRTQVNDSSQTAHRSHYRNSRAFWIETSPAAAIACPPVSFRIGWSVSSPSLSPRRSPSWIRSAGAIRFRPGKPSLFWAGSRVLMKEPSWRWRGV
jgi:nucleoside-diphosphate-sugar epimerase